MRIAEQAHALPLHRALYTPRAEQEIQWWKAITLTCRARREALQPYLPAQLALADDRVTVIVREHAQAGIDRPVFGGGIYLHARFGDSVGQYPIVTFSSSDQVVCANREELGEPTLLCDHASLKYQGALITAEIRRHDELQLSAAIGLDGPQGVGAHLLGEDEPGLHYKKIPNGDPSGRALREVLLIERSRGTGHVRQASSGQGSVALGTTIWNFHQIGPLQVERANFTHFEGGYSEKAQQLWAEAGQPTPPTAAAGDGGMTTETEGWAHPLHAPLYFPRLGQQTLWHHDVSVSFAADPNVLKEFIPEPLELAGNEVHVGASVHYQPGHGVPVRGSGVTLQVKHNEISGRYRILTVNTSDESVCANREELGQALILGDVQQWAKGNTWWGTASRNGTELIRVSVFPEKVEPPLDASADWINAGYALFYKKIPPADPTGKPWHQILAMDLVHRGTVHEHSTGRGTVEFGCSEWGLDRIKPLGPVRGKFYHSADSTKTILRSRWEDR